MSDGSERDLGRVEGKIDQIIEMMNRHFDDDRRNFSDLYRQVGEVKKKIYWLSGLSAAAAFVIAKITGAH